MKFFYRLAIALYRLLLGSSSRSSSRVRRSKLRNSKFTANNAYKNAYKYEQYNEFDSNEFDNQNNWNIQIASHHHYLTARSYSLPTHYYSSPYQRSYYPQIAQWQGIDNEYDEEYQDEYQDEYGDEYEEDLDNSCELVEYRFETFGGDTFIEYSYKGDLDEREILQALNWLWISSADRSPPNRFSNVLTGTLRMPPSRSISLLHGGVPYAR